MLGLASCNDSDAKNESSITFLADAFNLYSPLSGTGDCYAAFGTYSLKLEFPAQVVTMSATNMSTPNGGKTNFVLKPVQFQATGVEVDDNYREIFKFSAIDATESGDVVRGLTASLTQGFYQPQTIEGLDYKVLMPNAYAFPYYFVTEYQLNNHWRVRTFWPDETFRGTTAVGTGSSAKYLNDKMEYRVVIETDKNGALGKTADVIIYNAQFSEKMPASEGYCHQRTRGVVQSSWLGCEGFGNRSAICRRWQTSGLPRLYVQQVRDAGNG